MVPVLHRIPLLLRRQLVVGDRQLGDENVEHADSHRTARSVRRPGGSSSSGGSRDVDDQEEASEGADLGIVLLRHPQHLKHGVMTSIPPPPSGW
eukprot:752664-Hanusia_phi.AAC.3